MPKGPIHQTQVPALVRIPSKFILMNLWGWKLEGDLSQIPKGVIIGVPHTSNWDGPLAFLAGYTFGVRFRWMGKDSLFRWPMRPMAYLLGGIPIDRSSSHNAVEQMIHYIQAADTVILGIAPEGTRKRVPHWKTGFYYIALGAGVPIICGRLDWSRKIIDVSYQFYPSGDIEADMERIRQAYRGAVARRPENFGPIILPPKTP
jgi:1-acyl-sn-glycerol-3-phosphate acyltransferase